MNGEQSVSAIPADDPKRNLAVSKPDSDESLAHLGIVGDIYTTLLGGEQTADRFCLIDCTSRRVAGPHRIGMISRRCLPSLTARSR